MDAFYEFVGQAVIAIIAMAFLIGTLAYYLPNTLWAAEFFNWLGYSSKRMRALKRVIDAEVVCMNKEEEARLKKITAECKKK